MSRVLVAGGAGFIGSHLCERLLRDGHDVSCVDDLSTGARANIAPLLDHERFTLIEHDVTEPLDLDADRVFNLACPAAPVHYRRDPVRTLRTSVYGTMNLLELSTRCGARFLLASTSEIYGDPQVHPQPEDYWGHCSPTGPRACYHEGKRAAEALTVDFRRSRGADVRVARIFNTYGPRLRADDGRVIPTFVTRALQDAPIEVFGDGSQTRSFCYVDDLTDGLVRLMETPVDGPVNLGNPAEITISDLARRIVERIGSRSTLRHLPAEENDPRRRRPDIRRAGDLLGWSPMIALDEGLDRTISFFKDC